MIFTFRTTLWAILLSIAYMVIIFIFNIDVFESFVVFLEKLEHFELDEFIFPLLFIFLAALYDLFLWKKQKPLLQERNKMDKGIKAYSQHLAENFEEEMRVFIITAKKTPDIDPKLLRLFEKTIEETAKKIKATGNILPNFLGEPKKENNILF